MQYKYNRADKSLYKREIHFLKKVCKIYKKKINKFILLNLYLFK